MTLPVPAVVSSSVFDTSGNFLRRLISNGELNAPWGLALVEDGLWVGNFGDGRINNYNPMTGAFIETLMRADGTPLQFDGLWDLLPLGAGVYLHRRDRGRRARPIWADYRGRKLRTTADLGAHVFLTVAKKGVVPARACAHHLIFGSAFFGNSDVTISKAFETGTHGSFIDQICRRNYRFGYEVCWLISRRFRAMEAV